MAVRSGAALLGFRSKFSLTACAMFSLAVTTFDTALASGVASPSDLAVVRHVGHSKKGHFAVFDQGSDTGFVIGREVCFYGTDLQKLHCASIVRTKPKAAAVVLKPEDKDKITSGNYVWPEDMGPVTSYLVERVGKQMDDSRDDAKSLAEEEEDPPEPLLPPVLKSRTQVHLAPTMSLPIWMNDLRFEAGARASGTGEIWSSGDTIRGSVVGLGVRHHLPKNGNGEAAIDFTYHFVTQRPVKDDFDLTDGGVAAQSAVWAHHYRLRWLRGATWWHRDDRDLLLYTGFGYDMMMAEFASNKTGSSTGKLVSGTISAHALEIPLVVAYQHHLGSLMLTTGADMAIPIYVGGVTPPGTLHYNENVGNADKSLGGAIDAINVRRGWFAVALSFGAGMAF